MLLFTVSGALPTAYEPAKTPEIAGCCGGFGCGVALADVEDGDGVAEEGCVVGHCSQGRDGGRGEGDEGRVVCVDDAVKGGKVGEEGGGEVVFGGWGKAGGR